jgi:type IV secretory pathway VirB4 component
MNLFGFDKSKFQNNSIPKIANTESLIKFSEIRNNTIIMKDGSLRAIVKATGLNLDLKSPDEQAMAINSYKRFLNGIDFPIQILIHNTYLDLTDYINYLKDQTRSITNNTLAEYGKQYTKFLEQINLQEGLIYTKEFYIIIPYATTEKDFSHIRKPRWQKFLDILDSNESAEKIVARYRQFIANNKFLDTRVALVIE